MTPPGPKHDDLDIALQRETHADQKLGVPDESGVSPQYRVLDTAQPTVKADIEERQAVEVRPMRYVLGIGIALAVIAMILALTLFRHIF
jgi:hypothetical protein